MPTISQIVPSTWHGSYEMTNEPKPAALQGNSSQVVARFCMRCDHFSGRHFFCKNCAYYLTSTSADILLTTATTSEERCLQDIYDMLSKGYSDMDSIQDVLKLAAQIACHHDMMASRAMN